MNETNCDPFYSWVHTEFWIKIQDFFQTFFQTIIPFSILKGEIEYDLPKTRTLVPSKRTCSSFEKTIHDLSPFFFLDLSLNFQIFSSLGKFQDFFKN